MSLLRAFIAIEIPSEIKKAIASQSAVLQRKIGNCVRWVPAQNIHLTLQFLGEISPGSVEPISQALKAEMAQHPPFEFSIATLGAFPNPRRARVIWLGIQSPRDLPHLQHTVEQCTTPLGYPGDGKPFSPHLTIGRVREQASAGELQTIRGVLEETRIENLGTVPVQTIHLFKSELKPGGAVYTCLSTAQLAHNTR